MDCSSSIVCDKCTVNKKLIINTTIGVVVAWGLLKLVKWVTGNVEFKNPINIKKEQVLDNYMSK